MINADLVYILIGRRIKERREAAGLSQTNLAEAIKVSRASLANYESGTTSIYISDLYLISDHLGKDLRDFLPTIDEVKASASTENLVEKVDKEQHKQLKNHQKQEIVSFIETIEEKKEDINE